MLNYLSRSPLEGVRLVRYLHMTAIFQELLKKIIDIS